MKSLLITLFFTLLSYSLFSQSFTSEELKRINEDTEFCLQDYAANLGFVGQAKDYDYATREQRFGAAFLNCFFDPNNATICLNDLDPTGEMSLYYSPKDYLMQALTLYKEGFKVSMMNAPPYNISAPKKSNGYWYVSVFVTKEVSGIYNPTGKFYRKRYDLEILVSFDYTNKVLRNFKIARIRPGNIPEPRPKPDRDGDGVPDDEDKCPDVRGTRANGGCPEDSPIKKAILVPSIDNKSKLMGYRNYENGIWVIKPTYSESYPFENGFARVRYETKVGNNKQSVYNFIREDGKLIREIPFIEVRPFKEGISAVYDFVTSIEKPQSYPAFEFWNFVSESGQLLNKMQYEQVSDFQEGFAFVSNSYSYNYGKSSWAIMDKKGTMLTDFEFDRYAHFKNGWALVEIKGECYYIDKHLHKYPIGRTFDEKKMYMTEDGLAIGLKGKKGKERVVFINSNGDVAFKTNWKIYDVSPFSNGRAKIETTKFSIFELYSKSAYFYIDKSGKKITKTELTYSNLKAIDEEGFFFKEKRIKKNYCQALFDSKGKQITPFNFRFVGYSSNRPINDGLVAFSMSGEQKLGLMETTSGKIILSPDYKEIRHLNEKIAFVLTFNDARSYEKSTERALVYDKQRRIFLQIELDKNYLPYGKVDTDRIPVRDYSTGKWGYVDATGELVIHFQFEMAKEFVGAVAFVQSGKDNYFINRKGERVQ